MQITNRLKDWITIGGSPGPRGEHEGGTPVKIDASGKITAGPAALTGKPIAEVDQGKRKPGEKPKPPKNRLGAKPNRLGANDGSRRYGESGEGDEADSPGVASAPGRTSDEAAGGAGADTSQPLSPEAAQNVPKGGREERLAAINRLKGHADSFRKTGRKDQAAWLDQLQAHVKDVGVEAALESLGEEPESEGSPTRVQYGGADDEVGDTPEEIRFVKKYLDSCGITLLQPGTTLDPNTTAIWSLPLPSAVETPGGFVPANEFFENKLEEAKNLPGLESSEDIDKVVGKKVTQFTPEVVEKLDETYGKGKWIVKSYGDEAFAGFGIFFPQRVKQLQMNAKNDGANARIWLKDYGYRVAKQGEKVVGVHKDGKTFSIGSPEYAELPKLIQRLGKQAFIAAKASGGSVLPMSPEESIHNEYGMLLRRDKNDVPIGITTWDGKDYDFGDPKYKKIEDGEGGATGHAIHRALESDEKRRAGQYVEPRFMVQPAFEAVGVTDFDRAVGSTWETAKEGRVHCVTRDGKPSIIPYATLLGRGDSLPTVIQSEDSRAMEKAVEDAINKLPESKRRGQVYAPDVMKTKDGWRVIELNPSEASGGSAWLGGNPFVIDAMVSHMVGREPQHVKFMRDILKGKDVEVPRLKSYVQKAGTCKPGQRSDLTGCVPASGQAGAKKPARKPEKLGEVNTVRYGSYRASYSVHNRKRIDGPSLALPNYQQQDEHSCGFVAALTLSRYFDKDMPAEAVLRAVKPTVSEGIDRRSLVKALRELGVDPVYTEDLTVPKLRAYVDRGIPVAVTMWLEDYDTDHWTVVQGFDGDRIHLTNYGSVTIAQFRQDWYTPGLGVVCRPAKKEKSIVNRLVAKQQLSSPIAAGLAAVASDTGRVLMIQRPLGSGNDGKWELPGGRIEEGEEPHEAAVREWEEETGLELPEYHYRDDGGVNEWNSGDGKYTGFVLRVSSESALDLNNRDLFSDPDSEVGGVVAWVHPRDLLNHNLRPAILTDVDEVLAQITKWLLGQVTKSAPMNRLKASFFETPVNRLVQKAPCEQGETAAQTDCTPASGGGGKIEGEPKKAAPGSQLPPATLAKLKALGADKLPPADVPASEVKVNLDAGDSGALLTWKQTSRSGRVSQQSAYTAAFHAKNAAEKWDRVQRIEPVIGAIEKGLTARMRNKRLPQRQREAAAIASFIRETGLRPTDSAESVKHGHFGISSLQGQHVKVKGDEVHLDFIGKEGVRNQTVIRDPANVAFVKEAMKGTGPKDFLFKEANSGDAIKILKETSVAVGGPEDILVKDLRTVNATKWGEQATKEFKGPPPPLSGDKKKDAKALAKAILTMSGEVSKKLNNNPEMARDNYIHPRVFQKWLSTLSSAS